MNCKEEQVEVILPRLTFSSKDYTGGFISNIMYTEIKKGEKEGGENA